MIITLTLIGLFIVIIFAGRINLSIQFNKNIKDLFSQSKNISNKTFNYLQITGLPGPV